MAEFQIEGLEPVLAKMKSVKEEVSQKGVRSAAIKAMRIVRDAARAKARSLDDPTSPNAQIFKQIRTSYDARNSKRIGGVFVKVGVSGGARPRPGRSDTGHWRLLEFGSENNKATPFMRPALESNIQAVTNKLVAEIIPAIDKALAKAALKGR